MDAQPACPRCDDLEHKWNMEKSANSHMKEALEARDRDVRALRDALRESENVVKNLKGQLANALCHMEYEYD